MKYFIKTFGCQQNVADSERFSSALQNRGMEEASSVEDAQYVVVNTCMVRASAENRVYGLVNNLAEQKRKQESAGKQSIKIIVTGCMVGIALRDKTGNYLNRLKKIMPAVDEFVPIEEVGFDHPPLRTTKHAAWVPISNGCNNFCTFCIVPFTRGREISRPYEDVINECLRLKKNGYKKVTLLGQNVNSYGADLVLGKDAVHAMRDLYTTYFNTPACSTTVAVTTHGKKIEPVYVKHLGRMRIPTLFPSLLGDVAQLGFDCVDFISSNPWDFSDELIDIIAREDNVTRTLHLPIQSGDNGVLKRMNRWYTANTYMALIKKIRERVRDVRFTTDIIVGFCGETSREFEQTVLLCKKVGFEKAYISIYSQRPMTAATKVYKDTVVHRVKKERWRILDRLINKTRPSQIIN